MSVRLKIILIVLPLLVTTVLLATLTSSFAARNGISRIAVEALGFKAGELQKQADQQWNVLVENDLDDSPEYVQIATAAVDSFARTLIRSESELIFAVDGDGDIGLSTAPVEATSAERAMLAELFAERDEGWHEVSLGGVDRVGQAFYFAPFQRLFFVTDTSRAFFQEVESITVQSGIILAVSLVAAVLLLLVFTGYLTRPLMNMVKAMRGIIAANDLSQRVEVEYRDETGTLAQTFNIMIGELEKAYGSIKEFAFKAVLAQKNEAKIRNIFQKYVPKDVIDSFFAKPESMLVGQNRPLAILFSDIRSFTTISEQFLPDELVLALNRYFEIMVDIIMNRGGIVDKYIGDAIMAFFGAPVRHPDDALQAVYTALEMQDALADFNSEQEQMGKPRFNTGIGVNFGVVTVGNIGSERKMDYTIIGDMVNLGSRLEGLTKYYGQGLVFSHNVFRQAKKAVRCRWLDTVQVKGKTKGERIYTARLELDEAGEKAWGYHHAGLRRYYRRQFNAARPYFEEVLRLFPEDKPAKIFLSRIDAYIAEPPPLDWNGVAIMTEK